MERVAMKTSWGMELFTHSNLEWWKFNENAFKAGRVVSSEITFGDILGHVSNIFDIYLGLLFDLLRLPFEILFIFKKSATQSPDLPTENFHQRSSGLHQHADDYNDNYEGRKTIFSEVI